MMSQYLLGARALCKGMMYLYLLGNMWFMQGTGTGAGAAAAAAAAVGALL